MKKEELNPLVKNFYAPTAEFYHQTFENMASLSFECGFFAINAWIEWWKQIAIASVKTRESFI